MLMIIGLILTIMITLPVIVFAIWWSAILWYRDKLEKGPPTKDEWKVM